MLGKIREIRGLRLAAMICLMVTTITVFTPCFQISSLYAEVGLPLVGNSVFTGAGLLAVLFLAQIVLLFLNRKDTDRGAAAVGTVTFLLMLLVWYGNSLADELTGSIVYIQPGPAGFRVDISVLGLLALALCLTCVVLEWRFAVKRRS